MTLHELIHGLPVRVLHSADNGGDCELSDLVDDSRRATAGCCFVARAGSGDDGRRYTDDAIRRGAVAAIEVEGDDPRVVGVLAERFFGEPSKRLRLVGVTGTNGKSTICFLVQHLLAAAGTKCGVIGTVVVDDGRERKPAELTTPGPIDFSRYLARMVANGCTAAACEVSSHALHQGRAAALRFDVAIFTNLTGDHLDYHQTMDAYADAKAILFESLDAKGWAVVNGDDAYAERMVRDCKARVLRTTLKGAGDCVATISALMSDRSRATFTGPWGSVDVTLPLVGRHNVCNVLQSIVAANCVTAVARTLREALPTCPQVPGRLERVTLMGDVGCGMSDVHQEASSSNTSAIRHPPSTMPTVLVDYAHTHDSLENVLSALVPIAEAAGGRVICLFGCGGDRDKTKRPKMAQVAVRLADEVIVTSDNPRTEDPQAIIHDILAGIPKPQLPAVLVIPDRAAAIAAAVAMAEPSDTVLLAGKGHEDYQILGKEKIHFDDREHAAAALRQWVKDRDVAGRSDHGRLREAASGET